MSELFQFPQFQRWTPETIQFVQTYFNAEQSNILLNSYKSYLIACEETDRVHQHIQNEWSQNGYVTPIYGE